LPKEDDASSTKGDEATANAGEGAENREAVGPVLERFVLVGDAGYPGEGQTRVSVAMKAVCADRGGCDYGIMTGDNVYPAGVLSPTDPLWSTHFEAAFADLGFPFYAVLGNHDYGGVTETEELGCSDGVLSVACLSDLGSAIGQATGGIGLDPARPQHQVSYAKTQSAFVMDDNHYRFSTPLFDFAMIDSVPIYWDDANHSTSVRLSTLKTFLDPKVLAYAASETKEQGVALTQWRSSSTRRWRMVVGHHPYVSNGAHGNAGSYDGTGTLEGSGLPDGTVLKDFLETYVLQAGAHVFASGHDHNLMDLGEQVPAGRSRGTQMLLSGAGSKISARRTPAEAQNQSLYEVECHGFVVVEASNQALRLVYIVVPSGADSECAEQTEPWTIAHTRVVPHYEPG